MMKINFPRTAVLGALSLAMGLIPGHAFAENFQSAVEAATAEINKAAAMNYEWRDSRKMLEQAQELYNKGEKDKAMALVEKAGNQGKLAVAQAKSQADVMGPH